MIVSMHNYIRNTPSYIKLKYMYVKYSDSQTNVRTR